MSRRILRTTAVVVVLFAFLVSVTPTTVEARPLRVDQQAEEVGGSRSEARGMFERIWGGLAGIWHAMGVFIDPSGMGVFVDPSG